MGRFWGQTGHRKRGKKTLYDPDFFDLKKDTSAQVMFWKHSRCLLVFLIRNEDKYESLKGHSKKELSASMHFLFWSHL